MCIRDRYDDEDTLSETSFSTMEDQAYVGTMSFWLNLYEPDDQEYTLKFHDGEAYLVVYSFIGLSFMIRFLIVAAVASILLFIVAVSYTHLDVYKRQVKSTTKYSNLIRIIKNLLYAVLLTGIVYLLIELLVSTFYLLF